MRRRAFLLLVAAAALAIAAAVLVRSLGDGTHTLGGPPAPFSIEYPDGWKPFDRAELAAFASPPLAVLRESDGRGLLVVRIDKRFGGDLAKVAADLRKELDRRLPDFREVRAKVVTVKAGQAFFYSYIRERRGTVHAILVVPAGSRSYVLNSVSQPGADEAARELGEMFTSFALTP